MLRCLEGAPERVIDTDDSMTENRPEVRKMCPKQYPCYYAGYRRNIEGPAGWTITRDPYCRKHVKEKSKGPTGLEDAPASVLE